MENKNILMSLGVLLFLVIMVSVMVSWAVNTPTDLKLKDIKEFINAPELNTPELNIDKADRIDNDDGFYFYDIIDTNVAPAPINDENKYNVIQECWVCNEGCKSIKLSQNKWVSYNDSSCCEKKIIDINVTWDDFDERYKSGGFNVGYFSRDSKITRKLINEHPPYNTSFESLTCEDRNVTQVMSDLLFKLTNFIDNNASDFNAEGGNLIPLPFPYKDDSDNDDPLECEGWNVEYLNNFDEITNCYEFGEDWEFDGYEVPNVKRCVQCIPPVNIPNGGGGSFG